MAHINLLPWREAERKERNTEFGIMVAISAGLMAIVVLLVHLYFNAAINYQEQRNGMLNNEISLLDRKIKEIKNLEAEKDRLLARMNVIQQLQASRPLIVHLFEDLVTTLPEGVNLKSIVQKGSDITIEGTAQSNARVSSFMRSIEGSEYLKSPSLSVIQASDRGGQRLSEFTLKLKQVVGSQDGEESEEVTQ